MDNLLTILLVAAQTATSFVLVVSALYFFTLIFLGVRSSWALKARLDAQAATLYETPGVVAHGVPSDAEALSRFVLFYLVPCLNEALVVGSTVTFLRDSSPLARIIVIDDASSDSTGDIARALGSQVEVITRTLPDAQKGKGLALNAGYALVRKEVAARGLDPASVIVCVMDADGRLSDGALPALLPAFDEPLVGGLQLAVRIRNRSKFLTQFQNFQFWSLSALSQLGRMATGTVSLGGNGQFTRMSALEQLGDDPWKPSLTEDLTLALDLLANGWICLTTPFASVDQQGVESARALLRQRIRWYQGHMMAITELSKVWTSTHLKSSSALEAAMYLLVPWMLDLPWSLLYHFAVYRFFAGSGFQSVLELPVLWMVLSFIAIYIIGFYPALACALLSYRRDPEVGAWRSLFLGHSFLVMNYLSWVCCWVALYRIIRGRTSWQKTARKAEVD